MKLSEDLAYRGLIGSTTLDDIKKLDQNPMVFYLGADPSADSMTIGNLAALITALRLVRAGHKAMLLVGGATGLAGGDPDGKSETRAKIDKDVINIRVEKFKKQFQQILGADNVIVVNNYDWLSKVNLIDFLRNIGWNFSMTQLLDRQFVKNRIGEGGSGINYAEFSYSLLQGYDFYYLHKTYGVSLQLCGMDQFGNCASGMHLTSKLTGDKVDILAIPLVINKQTGKKFGKTEGGAVWLDKTMTSVYKFYQFWLNCDDLGVIDYLKIYTFLSHDKIEQLAKEQSENPGARSAQKALAMEVTKIVHGEQAARNACRVTEVLFGSHNLSDLDEDQVELLSGEIPTIGCGNTVIEILVDSGLVQSKSEAMRLISGNAISINGAKIASDQTIIQPSLIKKGKNNFVLVR